MIPTYLIQLVAWQVLPPVLTTGLLRLLHFVRPGPPPAKGSPAAVWQYKLVYTAVLLAYLGYTFVQAAMAVPENYYQMLGAERGADAQALQKAFRRFAVKFHPDRAGKHAEAMFVTVRQGYEALQSPHKRFAYERFGTDILTRATEDKVETLLIGLWRSVGFYVVAAGLMGIVKLNSGGRDVLLIWRATIILVCAALELSVVLRPTPLPLRILLADYLPFQYVDWLHQVSMSLGAGLGHIAPVWRKEGAGAQESGLVHEVMRMARIVDHEVMSLIQLDIAQLQQGWSSTHPPPSLAHSSHPDPTPEPNNKKPASPPSSPTVLDPSMLSELQHSMVNAVVESRLRGHPELRQMWDELVRRMEERERLQAQQGVANGVARPASPAPARTERTVLGPVVGGSPRTGSPMPGMSRTMSASHLPSPEPE